jgi:release factor glutamine methyltransferase
MKSTELTSVFKDRLSRFYDSREIQSFIFILLEYHAGWSKTDVLRNFSEELKPSVVSAMMTSLKQLEIGKPVQYITGTTWFNGHKIIVDHHVLIPRPETEELCTIIVQNSNENPSELPARILDIGTGSGSIAVDLKKNFPMAEVYAMDISKPALEIAERNARTNSCEITFLHLDIFDRKLWSGLPSFDLIVSNPPYIPESERIKMDRNVVDFEPESALFVPDSDPLLFYRTITDFCIYHLNSFGWLYFEIYELAGSKLIEYLHGNFSGEVELLKDFRGKERIIRARKSE